MSARLPSPENFLWFLVTLGATFLQGCGCEEERPYTPFQVATALPDQSTTQQEPEEATSPPPEVRPIQVVANRPSEWRAFGSVLTAPEGTGFVTGIELPDPGGTRAAAWVLPKNTGELGGNSGLWLFDAEGRAERLLARVPAHLPSGRDCRHKIELDDTGQRSFTTRLEASCSSRLLPGTATGAIIVVDPSLEQAVRSSFRLKQPSMGERLTYDVDSRDADGDGQEDLRLTVELSAPSGAKEELSFRWVGRPSGLSHVASTPLEEVTKRAGRLAIAAVRKKERGEAVDQIDALRRLLYSTCAESKTEKLTDGSGVGLSCGALGRTSMTLTGAAIQAHLGLGEPEKALGEFARRDDYFSRASGASVEEWKKKLKSALKIRPVRLVGTEPLPIGLELPYPIASPLKFGLDDELYCLTASGRVTRLFSEDADDEGTGTPPPPPSLDEWGGAQRSARKRAAPSDQPPGTVPEGTSPSRPSAPRSQAPAPWPLRPTGPNGEMLSAAVPSCERSEVQLAFSSAKSTPLPPKPLEILAPRPGGCQSLMAEPLPAEIIDFEGGQLLAIVGGQPVVSVGRMKPPGRPIAWGTSLGIALLSGQELTLLEGADTEGVHHCISNLRGTRIACAAGKTVRLFTRDSK